MSRESLKIVIAGDVVIRDCDAAAVANGSFGDACRDVARIIRGADMAVANLEAPVCRPLPGIAKMGPHLRMEPETLAAVAELGFDAVCLANNHIMDHGPEGLRETLAACGGAGLSTFGAGADLAAAAEPLVVDLEGHRIAFVGMAEHEFSMAGRDVPGAYPLDAIGYTQAIREYADRYDDLVVLIHGGLEHFPYPTPGLQRFARFAVELGASAVVCQHSHIVGCVETWRGRPIVYGQGNFLFQYPTAKLTWWEGALVELTLGGDAAAELIPIASRRDVPGVCVMEDEARDRMMAAVAERSECLARVEDLEAVFHDHVMRYDRWYLGLLDALPRLLRKLDHRWPIADCFRRPGRARFQFGMLSCESQREVLLKILGKRAGIYQEEGVRRRRDSCAD